MKKAIFIPITLFLAGCSAHNTPNFILKHTNKEAFFEKLMTQECNNYINNRVVQIDGVGGYYDYTTSDYAACEYANQEYLDVYQNPNRHGAHRDDIYPIGKTY